jgi:hypothetical protein
MSEEATRESGVISTHDAVARPTGGLLEGGKAPPKQSDPAERPEEGEAEASPETASEEIETEEDAGSDAGEDASDEAVEETEESEEESTYTVRVDGRDVEVTLSEPEVTHAKPTIFGKLRHWRMSGRSSSPWLGMPKRFSGNTLIVCSSWIP